MEVAWVAVGLGACYFMVSVGLDRSKSPLQQKVALVVGFVALGAVLNGLFF